MRLRSVVWGMPTNYFNRGSAFWRPYALLSPPQPLGKIVQFYMTYAHGLKSRQTPCWWTFALCVSMCKFRQCSPALELFYIGIDCASQSNWVGTEKNIGWYSIFIYTSLYSDLRRASDRDVNLLMASPADATGATPKNKKGSKRVFIPPQQVSGRTYWNLSHIPANPFACGFRRQRKPCQ